MQVVVLESNRETRNLLRHITKIAGHDVGLAANRGNFIVAVNMMKPETLIVDVVPATLEGVQERIETIMKALEMVPNAKVIVTSTSEMALYIVRSSLPITVRCLLKPFHIRTLIKELDGTNAHAHTHDGDQRHDKKALPHPLG